jgi:hypothetical protein
MSQASRKAEQLFWCIGALERLQGLGIVSNYDRHILPKEIDRWQQVDERRHEIIFDNRVLSSAITYLCMDAGMKDATDIEIVVRATIFFRDNRETMIKEFLERVI